MDTKIVEKNLRLKNWIHIFLGFSFLTPIITLLYKYTGLSLSEIILVANVTMLTVWSLELPTSVFADTSGRRKSLLISVISSFIGALIILIFPSFTGFIVAAIFSGLASSFWSGTIQAFTEENLKVIGKEKEFGKKTGNFMALAGIGGTITPFLASGLLKLYGANAYSILAGLDVISSLIVVLLVFQLREVRIIEKIGGSIKSVIINNFETAKSAFVNVFGTKKLKIILIYRILATDVSFFWLISLPLLVSKGMPDRNGGIVVAMIFLGIMIANKYAYKIGDRIGYNKTWIFSTIIQGIMLIITGLFLHSWRSIILMLICFYLVDGVRAVVRNHVLVEQSNGIAIATTRSVIISLTALYVASGRYIYGKLPVEYGLIIGGLVILIINILLAKQILQFKKP